MIRRKFEQLEHFLKVVQTSEKMKNQINNKTTTTNFAESYAVRLNPHEVSKMLKIFRKKIWRTIEKFEEFLITHTLRNVQIILETIG